MKDFSLQKYEVMLILHPEMGEEKTKQELDEIRELISHGEGKIEREDIWGIRDMAYTIKKQDKGYYVVLNMVMDPLKLKTLEKPLNINQAVLRYMILKTPEKYEYKTLEEYEEERLKEIEEKKKAEEEKEEASRKPKARPVAKKSVSKKKEEEPEEKKPEPKEPKDEKEVKPKEKTEKKISKPKEEKDITPSKSSKSTMEEVDKKLKSIIDDPDITL